MPSEPGPSVSQRTFMVLGSIVLVVAALYFASSVLIPLALAILLTFLLAPPAVALQRRGLPRPLAVTLVVLLAAAVVGCTLWVITLQLNQLANRLPEHSEVIAAKIRSVQGTGDGTLSKFQRFIEDILHEIQGTARNAEKPVPVVVQNDRPAALNLFPVVFTHVVELLASAILVVMLTAFMLMRREDLRDRLIQLIGHGRLTTTTMAMDEAAERISRYLLMQLTVNSLFGTLFGVALLVIGVPYAFLWGFLTATLRFVPYIGTWISLLFPLVVSVAVHPGWAQPLEVLIVFVTLELLTANVLEPLLFSHSTGASTVALLVAAAFWTWLWGPVGLFLSTPLTVCLLVLGRHVPALSFVRVLLGTEPVLGMEVRYYQRLLARDDDEAAEVVEEFMQTCPPERIYDDILLPALVWMKRDADQRGLPAETRDFILHATNNVMEDLAQPDEGNEGDRVPVLVLGCAVKDEVDELALEMFRRVMPANRCRLEILSAHKLSAEVVAQVREQRPAVVCLAAVPPGGLALARYLCKRLRSQVPGVKIVVGRWGQKERVERMEQQLRDAGADFVATTLLQTRAQVLPLLQVAAAPLATATSPTAVLSA